MGVISRPFKCKARFFHDSDREDWMLWYYAPPNAATFPHYHVFGNPAFMDSRIDPEDWKYPGPIPGTTTWFDGKNIWGYEGKAGCQVGTPEQFAKGLSIADANEEWSRPSCCRKPINDVCGGLSTMLMATITTTAPARCLCFFVHSFQLNYDPDTNSWHGTTQLGVCPQYVDIKLEVAEDPENEDNNYATLTSTWHGTCDREYVTTDEFACPFDELFVFSINGEGFNDECGCFGGTPLEGPAIFQLVIEPRYPSFICSGGITVGWPPKNYILATGGITIAGTSFAYIDAEFEASGGIIIAGEAIASIPAEWVATGGIIITGESLTELRPYWISIGGIVISGEADIEIAGGCEGPNLLGSLGQEGFSSVEWQDITNIEHIDESWAYAVVPGATATKTIVMGNWGFSVPESHDIVGIEVSVVCYRSGEGGIYDLSVYFALDSTFSDDKATASPIPITPATMTYGGVSNSWGGVFTGADVNDSDWKLYLTYENGSETTETVFVESVTVKVCHEPPT